MRGSFEAIKVFLWLNDSVRMKMVRYLSFRVDDNPATRCDNFGHVSKDGLYIPQIVYQVGENNDNRRFE